MYINFTHLPHNYHPLVWVGGGGHEIYNHLSPSSTDATYEIWNKVN